MRNQWSKPNISSSFASQSLVTNLGPMTVDSHFKRSISQVCLDGPVEPAATAQVAVLPLGGEFSPGAEVFLCEPGSCHQLLGWASQSPEICGV